MTTRRASEDSKQFRQERYMSSPEMQRGLLANCVAARVQALADPLHRKLIWWLQKVSWQPGALDRIAAELIERWPERFATATMQRIGIEAGRIYSAEEVKIVREFLDGKFESDPEEKRAVADIIEVWDDCGHSGTYHHQFPLRGETRPKGFDFARLLHGEDEDDESRRKWSNDRTRRAAELREARLHPATYPAKHFTDYCRKVAGDEMPRFLFEKLCLDPAIELNSKTLWYFPAFVASLSELHDIHAEAAAGAPVTEIGAKIAETLEYAVAERGLVVIDGLARTGKTFAVKAWCDQHPGQARYVQVPASNDDMTLFRALAEALGIGASHAYKALELRGRVETVLHTGDLLLVLDEGWALWPQKNLRKAMPARINWVLMQLVNMGVPVAIVTTPQFTKNQEALVRNTGWSAEQLVGRIMHYERLPDLLGEEDLRAVARHWLPAGDDDSIEMLTTYAQSSEKYLQGIESLVRRSRFLAKRAGRIEPTFQDVASALKEGVVPSDNAIASALTGARPKPRKRAASMVVAEPLQGRCRTLTKPAKLAMRAGNETFQAPARDSGESVLST